MCLWRLHPFLVRTGDTTGKGPCAAHLWEGEAPQAQRLEAGKASLIRKPSSVINAKK